MPKYLVIYHTHVDWPMTGPADKTDMQGFNDPEKAREFVRDFMDAFDICDEVHLYEYTGIQYVLVERWHK